MSARFSLTLLGIIILAVIVGVLLAQSQPKTVAAPATPTAVPTSIPSPGSGQVFIEPGSGTASYVPARIVVSVGQKVTWKNLNSTVHSVTADNSAFNKVLSPGQTFTWRAKKAGTYSYGDFLNPGMSGVVVVQP
jgi:plastocyanin